MWLHKPFWLASVNSFLIKEHISKHPKPNVGNPNIIKACAKWQIVSTWYSTTMISRGYLLPLYYIIRPANLCKSFAKERQTILSLLLTQKHEEKQMSQSTYESGKRRCFWTPPSFHLTCCQGSRDSRDLDFCQGKCFLMWNTTHQCVFSLVHIRKW